MKTLLTTLGVLLLFGCGASAARAQCWYPYQAHFSYPYPVPCTPNSCPIPPPPAPDACGPGYYVVNCCGQVYGPNYYVYPPFPPFQGMVPTKLPPCPPGGNGNGNGNGGGNMMSAQQQYMMMQARFPSHPYARSPRDFYMKD